MIPLAIPNLAGNEGAYLNQCVETNFVSSVGPFVDRFETMVAQASGAKYAVATSSGTTGLHAALIAAGVGPQDLVILPSFTFIASANAIAHCGAAPWLFDVGEHDWCLDPQQVEQALKTKTERRAGGLFHKPTGRRVAAILPVYTLGLPADMDSLVNIAREFSLPVVADGAAALGALYKDRSSGDLGADLTVYSFNGNKTVTAGGGGAIAGSDKKLCQRARHLTTTARIGADYDYDAVGFNYRMTNIQAAVGCAQMELLDQFVAKKRTIAEKYTDELTQLDGVGPLPSPPAVHSACWFSGVTVSPELCELADIRKFLRDRQVDARPFWKPVHLQAPYRDAPAETMAFCERLWPTVLTLPCSTNLSQQDQTIVIGAVRAYLEGAGTP